HEESGDERRAWAGGGGVTNTCTAFSVCTGTGNSSPSGAPPRTRESNREHHSTHNPSGEARRASCMRENRTYSSYGEGLETDRARRSAPRQPLTRQDVDEEVADVGDPREQLLDRHVHRRGQLLEIRVRPRLLRR